MNRENTLQNAMVNNNLTTLHKDWGWILTTGVLFMILGLISFAMPVASSVGLTLALAGLLVATGIIHLVQAFRLRGRKDNAMRVLQAVISVVIGGLMFRYPGSGMMGVTLALSFYFFVRAALQWIMATGMTEHRGWGMFSAVLSFLLGIFMIATFPVSALWVPGTLLGIDLVFFGATLVGLSFAARKVAGESTGAALPSR